jgi:4-amino-4-deoxy-L-arabinose transferase-like glycosyltransferase
MEHRCDGRQPHAAAHIVARWMVKADSPVTSYQARPAPAAIRWLTAWLPLNSVPFLLGCSFLCIYALTSAGQLDSADGTVVAATARQLVEHHTVALPPGTPEAMLGAGGFGYSKYGIGQSIVEIPFVLLGLLLRHLTGNAYMVDWTISLTNSVLTALGCVVFYLIARLLGASARRGVALTLLYGLSTLAWVYAKTDFTEPLQTLGLLLAVYSLLRARETGHKAWVVAAGGALAVLIMAKAAEVIVVPAFVLYVLSLNKELVGVEWRRLRGSAFALESLLGAFWCQVALLAPVALACGVTLWLNVMRFGSPLNFGYDYKVDDVPFANPLYIGAFGLLFSFNSGLIFYATPVVLGLVGIRRFTRQFPREVVLFALTGLMILTIHSGWVHWAGLSDFGPRYLVPMIPLLLLPGVEAFPGVWTHPREHRRALAVIAGISLLGMFEQSLGIIVSFRAYAELTCLISPCPASLNASQSELLYDVWLLPTAMAYNFLGHMPHIGLSAYPFGAPPPGRPGWEGGLVASMKYFWFEFLPHPRVALAAGCLVFGSAIAVSLTRLNRLVGLLPLRSEHLIAEVQGERGVLVGAVRRVSNDTGAPGV